MMRLRSLLDYKQLELGWWLEISTALPECTYYFGPFESEGTAIASQTGYIEDLEDEGAKGIVVWVKKCQPPQLTIEA